MLSILKVGYKTLCTTGFHFVKIHTPTHKEKKLRVPIHLVLTMVEIIQFLILLFCLYFLIFP